MPVLNSRFTGGLAACLCLFLIPTDRTVVAQGLSGVPQRLVETAPVSFDSQVAVILKNRCGQCHIRGSKGNFRMSSFNELMRMVGAVTPGNPGSSKIYTSVQSGEMPPKGGMPQAEKDTIKRWIEQGAKFDGADQNANLATLGSRRGSSAPSSGRGGPPARYSGGPPAGY